MLPESNSTPARGLRFHDAFHVVHEYGDEMHGAREREGIFIGYVQDLAAGVSDVAQLRDIEHQEERDRAGYQAHDDDKRRQKASRADVAPRERHERRALPGW